MRSSLYRRAGMGLGALALLAALPLIAPPRLVADEPKPWTPLKDGDRIVLVGDTFIERDQQYGHLETAITLAHPNLNLTFRNLGWSGDTVHGLSRAGFDPPEAGWNNLKQQIQDAKPTVVILGYGMADSFDGKAGLSRFKEHLDELLGEIAKTGSRVVLLSPIAHENLGFPLPDPTKHNADLAEYSEVIRTASYPGDSRYVELIHDFGELMTRSEKTEPFTDNGIHLTDRGYAVAAGFIISSLGLGTDPSADTHTAALGWDGTVARANGVKLAEVASHEGRLRFIATADHLAHPGRHDLSFELSGMPAGRYVVTTDGQEVARGTAQAGKAETITITKGPDWQQVEALRKRINEKNLLFFYRWRPQNITYLFGFRKHEQGNNAVEIPKFDPLVEQAEAEIAQLRKPRPHTYEIILEKETAQ